MLPNFAASTLEILPHFRSSSSISFVPHYTHRSLSFSTTARSSRRSELMRMESIMGMKLTRKRIELDNNQRFTLLEENGELLTRATKKKLLIRAKKKYRYGIMHVETGSLLNPILPAEEYLEIAPEIPQDLYHLLKKATAIRNHLKCVEISSKKDKGSRYGLICLESKIQRFVGYYKKTKKLPPTWRYFLRYIKFRKRPDKSLKYRMDNLRQLLLRILRHKAPDLKLYMRSDGYVIVRDLLSLNIETYPNVPLSSHTINDIIEVIKMDKYKQRFSLIEENGELLIRANEDHTIELVETESLLIPILSPEEYPVCVHGTYKKKLKIILENGLKRVQSLHVRFSCELPTKGKVISGMNTNINILIFLDIQKAIKDGMKFYISEKRVILTEGFDGVVPVKYFEKIELWPDRKLIPIAPSSQVLELRKGKKKKK